MHHNKLFWSLPCLQTFQKGGGTGGDEEVTKAKQMAPHLPPNVAACGPCWPLTTPLINPTHGKSTPSNGLHHQVCIVGLGSHGIGILTHIKGPPPMALFSCVRWVVMYVWQDTIQMSIGTSKHKKTLSLIQGISLHMCGVLNVYGRTLH